MCGVKARRSNWLDLSTSLNMRLYAGSKTAGQLSQNVSQPVTQTSVAFPRTLSIRLLLCSFDSSSQPSSHTDMPLHSSTPTFRQTYSTLTRMSFQVSNAVYLCFLILVLNIWVCLKNHYYGYDEVLMLHFKFQLILLPRES
jgi:hypothetical protein